MAKQGTPKEVRRVWCKSFRKLVKVYSVRDGASSDYSMRFGAFCGPLFS